MNKTLVISNFRDSIPEVVRRVHPYLHHADQYFDNHPFDVGIRIRPCRMFLSLALNGQDVECGLVMPEHEMRILVARLG